MFAVSVSRSAPVTRPDPDTAWPQQPTEKGFLSLHKQSYFGYITGYTLKNKKEYSEVAQLFVSSIKTTLQV